MVGSGTRVGLGVFVGAEVGVGVATTIVGVGNIVAGGTLLGFGAVKTDAEKTSDIYTSKVFIKSMAAASFLTLLSYE